MSDKKTVVELHNLSTGYCNKHATHVVASGLNDCIYSDELTCLLGANGSGKSTLLKTLSAFLDPLGGEVIINGRNLKSYNSKELARQVGVVLTERCNIRNMYVTELVGMGRSPYTGFWGSLSADDYRIIDESLSFVHIEHLKHRMVHTLSDGERQKVMIAKALAQQTPIIFLDEPTAFLDYPSKVEIMQLLYRLSKDAHRTVFLSTHDMELALQIADRIWLMRKGDGVITGTPEDLSLNGALSDFFPDSGVVFDPSSGLYQIRHDYIGSINVKGDETSRHFLMLCKALNRINIAVNDSKVLQLDVTITCNSGKYDIRSSSSYFDGIDSIDRTLHIIHSVINH